MAEENDGIGSEDAQTPAVQTPEYRPRETLIKMATIAGVTWKDFENDVALITAIEGQVYKVEGDKLLRSDGSTETEVNIEEELKKLEEEEKKANPLEVTSSDENGVQSEQQEDNLWIAEKNAYYKNLSEANKIDDYQHDEAVTNGFAAGFNDAKIYYKSKTNVSVSKDAGYKVFDVMLKEPHNVGRPVNFSDKMPTEMAARLYAACLVNGNQIGGNVPQFTDEQLKTALGDADYAVFQAQMAERTRSNQPPTKEEIKQAMKDQYEMSVMENNGKIEKSDQGPKKGEKGTDEELQKYNEMSKRAQTGKKMLFELFKKDPETFRAMMNEVIEEEKLGIKLDDVKLKIQERENTEKGNKTYAGFEDQRDTVRSVGLEIPNIGSINLSRGER